MEKKIERVPYISKWYKEELDWSQLFKFDFKDEPMTEFGVNKFDLYDKNLYTYSTNTTNGLWTTRYSKPTVQLKFEHHLTQQDVDYLRELLRLTRIDIESIKHVPSKESDARYRLGVIENYIRNAFGIRDKAQRKQLEELIEQSKPKKSHDTLGEHKEELQKLYQVKEQCGFKFIKDFANGKIPYSTTLSSIKEILGIDFIKDFIKSCEKCEE